MRYVVLFIIATAFSLLYSFSTVRAEEAPHHSTLYGFEDFPAQVGKFKKARLQLKEGDEYWVMRTQIRTAYKGSPNFAGGLILIELSSGGWTDGVIIDPRTGRISKLPGAELGYDYHPGSGLLIVNPFLDYYYQRPAVPIFDRTTGYFFWNGKRLVSLSQESWTTVLPDHQKTGSIK